MRMRKAESLRNEHFSLSCYEGSGGRRNYDRVQLDFVCELVGNGEGLEVDATHGRRREGILVCEVVVAERLVHVGEFRLVVGQNRFHVRDASLCHFENRQGRS